MSRSTVGEGARFSLGVIVSSFIALVLVVVIGAMWIFGFGFFQRSTAGFRGETEQIERVQADPNYRIQAYDSFFNRCAAVQNKEATIKALKAELETNPPQSRVTQINATITALTAARAADINQYNADASKTDTRANFQASNLPYRLNENVESTSCAA